MRWNRILTLGFLAVAALVPWTARGEALKDARHQRRHEAANILRGLLQQLDDSTPGELSLRDSHRTAVARAIRLVGPDSRAATELTSAIRELGHSTDSSEATWRSFRERINRLCKGLEFAPTMEAEMPSGFPAPTPVGEIELKQYPAYRMAQTRADETPAFWTLFGHIKRNKIAMTAPVEMTYESPEAGGAKQNKMAFLYPARNHGETGSDGAVQIVDVPSQTVLSTGVRGKRTPKKLASAQARLTRWLEAMSTRYRKAGPMRVMGYNSPFIPANRSYLEVQIPVVAIEGSAPPAEPRAFDLSDYVWKNRVLLAFVPARDDKSYLRFREAWDSLPKHIQDRDLFLVEIFETGEGRAGVIGVQPSITSKLRKRFKVPSGDSTFILIGKDGTVKLRRSSVQLPDLFDLIDAMPMRRAEMSRQKTS